jgi:hypothetical protein
VKGLKITRTGFLKVAILIKLLFIPISFIPHYTFPTSKNYSRLIGFIKLQDKEAPFYAFNGFEEGFDEDSHKANLEYFDENPELIRKIQKNLGCSELQWRLDNLKHRLLFVPETREEYATLFETYCKEAIDYILEKTNLDNPYGKIETLLQEGPEISPRGVKAFLVHNLAREFVATYTFSNHGSKALKIQLNGKILLGEVGSYSSYISLGDNGTPEFVGDNHTIWQNSAKNPYKVLAVPVEETLHIVLRKHTHRAIEAQLVLNSVRKIKEAEKIVEEWIAVEEAIVGGVVHALLPDFLKKCVNGFRVSLIEEDIESKCEFKKYRHLKKGIDVVKNIGYEKTIKIYMDSPVEFRRLLTLPARGNVLGSREIDTYPLRP